MASDRFEQQARDLFMRALDLASDAQRAEFVTQQCGEDAELRAHVMSLLQAHAHPDSAVVPRLDTTLLG